MFLGAAARQRFRWKGPTKGWGKRGPWLKSQWKAGYEHPNCRRGACSQQGVGTWSCLMEQRWGQQQSQRTDNKTWQWYPWQSLSTIIKYYLLLLDDDQYIARIELSLPHTWAQSLVCFPKNDPWNQLVRRVLSRRFPADLTVDLGSSHPRIPGVVSSPGDIPLSHGSRHLRHLGRLHPQGLGPLAAKKRFSFFFSSFFQIHFSKNSFGLFLFETEG